MNILILGSGGREHTLAWKLRQSPQVKELYVAPGNAGTSEIAENLPIRIDDFEAIKKAALDYEIHLILVGPEIPLVLGIHDFFLDDPEIAHIPVIGPRKLAATLEGSKQFAKEFMKRHHIPTAAYRSFTAAELHDGYAFLDSLAPPYVLKADGLAAGKGVLILHSLTEAKEALEAMLINAKFGAAGATVVIEEFLSGIELSCFVLTDGKNYHVLPTAKDYKRIGEGDTGLNTGGMGAISPVPFAGKKFMEKVQDQIVGPTMEGLKKDQMEYKGFIFIGLIKVGEEPFVIEYNVRLGDPETEVIIPRIKNDLATVLKAVGNGTLDRIDLEIDERAAGTVVVVAGGYPELYGKGDEIRGINAVTDSVVFHAGTRIRDGKVITDGGRVLAITSYGRDFRQALQTSYQSLQRISYHQMYYRKDLGFDL